MKYVHDDEVTAEESYAVENPEVHLYHKCRGHLLVESLNLVLHLVRIGVILICVDADDTALSSSTNFTVLS